jgi:hypothetical protein
MFDDEQHLLYASMYVDIMGKCFSDSALREMYTQHVLEPYAQKDVQSGNKSSTKTGADELTFKLCTCDRATRSILHVDPMRCFEFAIFGSADPISFAVGSRSVEIAFFFQPKKNNIHQQKWHQ